MKAQLITVALGLWLMAAPAVLDYGDPAAASDRILGPMIASFATVALWPATRPLGRVNIVLGICVILAPVLGYPMVALINSIVIGASVVALSILQGDARGQFGGGWSALWRSTDREPRGGRGDGRLEDERIPQ